MKSVLGITGLGCAWALSLGCSAGVPAPAGDDGTSTLNEALLAPDALPPAGTPTPPDPNSGPFCGGIAAIECPGAGSCVDDPSDDCDLDNGGADCGGVCACNALALCIEGNVFDASPDVCACVPEPELDPCAAVRCAAGTHCEVVGEGAICAPDESVNPCAAVLCATGKHCVARGSKARCVRARRGHDCRRDD